MASILEIHGLSFDHQGEKLFHNLSFTANQGESTVILGASGSGKTTLLKLAAGITSPASGQVLLNGINVHQSSSPQIRSLYRRLGFLFQDTALIANLNIFENLALPLRYHGFSSKTEIQQRTLKYLHRFDLEDYAEILPAQISVGLKKRAALARALISDPEILFLDDPLAEADQRFQEMILHITQELKNQNHISIITTTSHLTDATLLGDRILLLHQGKIIKAGGPQEIEALALNMLKEG
jgi:phospholipid/cholesterol/gamma-HCH transport system ATP-binding protein